MRGRPCFACGFYSHVWVKIQTAGTLRKWYACVFILLVVGKISVWMYFMKNKKQSKPNQKKTPKDQNPKTSKLFFLYKGKYCQDVVEGYPSMMLEIMVVVVVVGGVSQSSLRGGNLWTKGVFAVWRWPSTPWRAALYQSATLDGNLSLQAVVV